MSAQDIVLAGFGSSGSVSLIVTSGYASSTAPTPVSTIPTGGSGYPVYWQGKRRKRKLTDQPNKHLAYILDKVVSEYYGEIISSDLPQAVKKEAAAVVKPFVETKKKGIPKTTQVDWAALQRDADAVGTILQIWHEELLAKEIEDEDEFMMMH